MNYANIKYTDIANGPGVRTTLFVSGCRLHCPGCFNAIAWDLSYGEPFTSEVAETIMESMEPGYVAGLTILGGEPTEPENAEGLAPFLEQVRARFGTSKSIWLYSGRTWGALTGQGDHASKNMDRVLSCLNVLVDGPFVEALHDITLRFKGSSNQRLIDVPATLAAHAADTLAGPEEVIEWQDDPGYTTHTF